VTYGWQLATEVDDRNPVVGDLRIDGSRLALLSTLGDRVAQPCTDVLNWWEGEWFADRARGVPYIRSLLRRGVREATVRAVLRRQLRAVDGVREVQSMEIEINRATRRCVVRKVVVITTDGAPVTVSPRDLALGGS
jgi:hypothetical protein